MAKAAQVHTEQKQRFRDQPISKSSSHLTTACDVLLLSRGPHSKRACRKGTAAVDYLAAGLKYLEVGLRMVSNESPSRQATTSVASWHVQPQENCYHALKLPRSQADLAVGVAYIPSCTRASWSRWVVDVRQCHDTAGIAVALARIHAIANLTTSTMGSEEGIPRGGKETEQWSREHTEFPLAMPPDPRISDSEHSNLIMTSMGSIVCMCMRR